MPRAATVLLVLIGLGGVMGALARFQVSNWVSTRTNARFPWGTLAVNLSGALALGILLPLLEAPTDSSAMVFLTVGCLGSFTTFSTLAHDAVSMLEKGRFVGTALYAAASLGLGLLAIGGGALLAQRLL